MSVPTDNFLSALYLKVNTNMKEMQKQFTEKKKKSYTNIKLVKELK